MRTYDQLVNDFINHKLSVARNSAKAKGDAAYLKALSGTNDEWLDYLHERQVSQNMTLTVSWPGEE